MNFTESQLFDGPKAPALTSCSMSPSAFLLAAVFQTLLLPASASGDEARTGDAVVEVLEPHQRRPLVTAAERDRHLDALPSTASWTSLKSCAPRLRQRDAVLA